MYQYKCNHRYQWARWSKQLQCIQITLGTIKFKRMKVFLFSFYLYLSFYKQYFFINPNVTDIQSHWSWECAGKYYFSTNNLGVPKRLPWIYMTRYLWTWSWAMCAILLSLYKRKVLGPVQTRSPWACSLLYKYRYIIVLADNHVNIQRSNT